MNKGIRVVIAGTGINLSLGILYTWSIFKESIKESITAKIPGSFSWDMASINDPYAVACLVFAFMMIYAGRIQDKFGARITAFIGGILVSIGFMLIARSSEYWVWVLGFGGLVGTGIAFGYASATPVALKWFPPNKSGLIAGIVVSGFGLASAYIAPAFIVYFEESRPVEYHDVFRCCLPGGSIDSLHLSGSSARGQRFNGSQGQRQTTRRSIER